MMKKVLKSGAFVWISSFLFAGFFFGNLPAVKTNFHVVIFAVILISFLPLVIEFWKARKKA
jgi:membrane-associated protein